MFDPKSLLDQVLGAGSSGASGKAGSDDLMRRGRDLLSSQRGGLAIGGLAGLLLGTKTGRKLGKKAVTYGGLALVAGLAYRAYQDYQAGKQGRIEPHRPTDARGTDFRLEAPKGTGFDPAQAPGGEARVATALLSAMIAAAKADGHIDAEEQRRIFGKMDEAGLGADEKAFLMDELRAPLDMDKVVALARTPEEAAEIYAASRLAIDPDHRAEKAYLDMLAARLDLDPALVDEIEYAVREAELS